MVSYNDLVERAKKIGLKNRTKYRTIATLSEAIGKHKNISIPYRNLDQIKVTGLRKILTEFQIPGWSKDRTQGRTNEKNKRIYGTAERKTNSCSSKEKNKTNSRS